MTSRRRNGWPSRSSRWWVIVGDQGQPRGFTLHIDSTSQDPTDAVASHVVDAVGLRVLALFPSADDPARSTPRSRDSLRPIVATRSVLFRPRGFSPPRRFAPQTGVRAYCSPLPAGVHRLASQAVHSPPEHGPISDSPLSWQRSHVRFGSGLVCSRSDPAPHLLTSRTASQGMQSSLPSCELQCPRETSIRATPGVHAGRQPVGRWLCPQARSLQPTLPTRSS